MSKLSRILVAEGLKQNRILAAAVDEPPAPDEVDFRPALWEDWGKESVAKSVALLGSVVKLVRYAPNDFYNHAQFADGQRKFSLTASQLSNDGAVASLVRQWSKVEELTDDFAATEDPFYDNLNGSVKQEFGSSKGKNLAYAVIVRMTKSTGTRWHR